MDTLDSCPNCGGQLWGRGVFYCPVCMTYYAVNYYPGIPQQGRDYGDEARQPPLPRYPECERVQEPAHLAARRDAVARKLLEGL